MLKYRYINRYMEVNKYRDGDKFIWKHYTKLYHLGAEVQDAEAVLRGWGWETTDPLNNHHFLASKVVSRC